MAATDDQRLGDDVCVVGAGVIGLVTTKNLLEQGLNVTTFERHPWLGGTWHVSQDGGQTTALEQTRLNTSKQAVSLKFPKGYREPYFPIHPPARDVQKYLESYAEHFNVLPHIQFSTTVDHVERDEANKKWLVYVKDEETSTLTPHEFDRVAIATGVLNAKRTPTVKGIERFAGEVVHSREFKMPAKYEGKNVVVVGIGASGADSTSFLVKAKANKVYLSHRAQFFLLPRMVNGKAFDHTLTRRLGMIVRCFFSWSPRICGALMSKGMIAMRKKAFPWLGTHPSFTAPRAMDGILHRVPFFSDDMAENLRESRIETVQGVQEVTGPKSVTLTDGSVLEDIDAIVFCTGYQFDFSVIRGAGDPTDSALAPDHYKAIESAPFHNPGDKFARLYKGFLSEQYPDSLAFLGHMLIMKPPILLYDIVSMALASVWSGAHAIEPPSERREDIDTQYNYLVSTLQRGRVQHLGFRVVSTATYEWLNRAAGTGVVERLGYCTWESWKLWWTDSKLYYALMDGFDTPAAYRLFDMGRGRKPWAGARARIDKVNEELKELGENWKREQKEKRDKKD